MTAPAVRPELTALRRAALSAPARQALEDGLLDATVLDYGCGRGGDVDRLSAAGLPVRGWDPHYRPEPPPVPADTVLCSYVLNVVADPQERHRTAAAAWGLARRRLVVAVRTTADDVRGRPHGDGTVTARDTFHHLYGAAELRAVLHAATGTRPVTVRPGLAYVFRDDAERLAYLARRLGGQYADDPGGETAARLAAFLLLKGRRPEPAEQPSLWADAARAYGHPARALAAARAAADPDLVRAAAARTARDLMVMLALDKFSGAQRPSDLPFELAADARAFPGGRRAAAAHAQRLLFAAGRPEEIRAAVRRSPVGKTSPTALYAHADAERHLPPVLRLYSACAEFVVGRPAGTNLLKLHTDRAAVSFLQYPEFDSDPHPRLAASVTVDLKALDARLTDYRHHTNRPLLHRKEEFLHPDDPRFAKYRRLTLKEISAGLYSRPDLIGRENGWDQVLADAGKALRGHRLVAAPPPA